jgi:hypothetical protein
MASWRDSIIASIQVPPICLLAHEVALDNLEVRRKEDFKLKTFVVEHVFQ